MVNENEYSNLIKAYALKNAIDYGSADASKVLPKLFQHGLPKGKIEGIMPLVNEIVSEVNNMKPDDLEGHYYEYSRFVKVKEEKERTLPELKGAKKGKVVLRIAPFPSGALHIGNAKTFILNSLYAEKYEGKIILVMDDTIGSINKPIDSKSYGLIEDGLKWLGIEYSEKIYKSDRLEKYYEYALKLIKKDKAYVCYCDQNELRENRAAGRECGCRHFPKAVQLLRWEEMFKMDEGHATLRIKTSMQDKNPAFRDRVLFKISDREHPRIGKKYRVWPSLEMSWAVDDYLLGITHVIRGNDLSIESEMERLVWEILEIKGPEIIHTGIVNIEGVIISKSKSQAEVKGGIFSGWNDPRTWSLQSLKERGISPIALTEFVKDIGLNIQNITIPIESLYSLNRKQIDSSSMRYSFIKDPVKLEIRDIPKGLEIVSVPLHPDIKKERKIRVGELFISREDFESVKGDEARLLHLFNLEIADNEDEESKFTSIGLKSIPKFNWVSDNVKVSILMPNGEKMSGIGEVAIKELKIGEVIQFERFGFVRLVGVKDGVYEFWFGHK
jgi:glutamyl-tRNA synthetase